ncbi:MFS transporter [Heyndrickxia acidicola]|uniref:MFS transporter n=1 Tax=Heyndrickxia acidicola TaxID=209389 RepID=A0ABU6MKB5_9BACI|nr:MFS transporter [Heyndrickxia acidicola]MED1204088.1 MFS transporter [Heyndrickxia acidicola]
MDKRVYLLTTVSFVVGMVELMIGGLLDIIAADLHVSLGKAGFLITIFSLVFAVSAPILLTITAKIERKRLTLSALCIFLAGNALAAMSHSYGLLLLARVLSAASGSLLVVLCVTMASNIVEEKYRARSIGVVFMGISASLVLGVPIGLMLGNNFGWQAPFVLICVLTAASIAGVYFFMEDLAPTTAIPLRKQLATLKDRKILFAQITSYLFLAGHLTLYGYLTPFLKESLGLNGNWVSAVYLIFGIAAVAGGGIGGFLADRFGTKRTILGVIIVFAISIFSIPFTIFSFPIFLTVMAVWSMLSWAVTPAMQSYLIELSSNASDIQQGLNNSALHLGIASGSFIGGIVIEKSSIDVNPEVGGIIVLLALCAAVISMAKQKQGRIVKTTK